MCASMPVQASMSALRSLIRVLTMLLSSSRLHSYVEQLNTEFGIAGMIVFSEDDYGQPRVWLKHAHRCVFEGVKTSTN